MCEFAEKAGVGIVIREGALPVRPEVLAAAELLGLGQATVYRKIKRYSIARDQYRRSRRSRTSGDANPTDKKSA